MGGNYLKNNSKRYFQIINAPTPTPLSNGFSLYCLFLLIWNCYFLVCIIFFNIENKHGKYISYHLVIYHFYIRKCKSTHFESLLVNFSNNIQHFFLICCSLSIALINILIYLKLDNFLYC